MRQTGDICYNGPMTCPRCGFDNPTDHGSCARCGEPLPDLAGMRPGDAVPWSADVTQISERHYFPDSILGGRFTLLKAIGRGGMGEIFLAEDQKLQRRVAIKSIGGDALSDADARGRFLREAQMASRLDHPNICTVFEVAQEGDREYIIMQYVDGVSLDQLIQLQPLSLEKVLEIALQAADGLVEAHAQGVIHRDIKPANIMLDRNGKVKILDFGLAKPGAEPNAGDRRGGDDLTEKGVVLGTVAYMSPEQARGHELDGRSDIFSFGVVLFEMIERRNPFSDGETIATLYNILHRDVAFSREVPPSLAELVLRCLRKDMRERFASMAEVRDGLQRQLAGLRGAGGSPAPAATEILSPGEQQRMLREAEGGGAAASENLAELVRRIKRQKASTEALRSGTRRRRWWWLAMAPLLLGAAGALLVWRTKPPGAVVPPPARVVCIQLEEFQNRTGEGGLEQEVGFLLEQALGQLEGVHLVDAATARRLVEADDLKKLFSGFRAHYVLGGTLTHAGDKINIEARLRGSGRDQPPPFFIPGKERNSLLTDQVDTLARRVQQLLLPDGGAKPPKLLAGMFGSDWKAFRSFFRGKRQWDRKEYGPALQSLRQAERIGGETPAIGYFGALLNDYSGSSAAAANAVNRLVARVDLLGEPLRLRLMALRAKLLFRLEEQVAHLEKLKGLQPYDREIYYQLGEAYFRCGDAERAIPPYRLALAFDPGYADALNHMGYCHSYLGDHRLAIEYFEKYKAIDNTPNSFDSLGDGHFYEGEYVQAENCKVYALSQDPAMYWPNLTLADIAILRASFRPLAGYLDDYVRRSGGGRKEQADALGKRAFAARESGDPRRALQLAGESLRLYDSPELIDSSAEGHWLRGLLRLEAGDWPGAQEDWLWLEQLRTRHRLDRRNFHPALKYGLHLAALIAEREGRTEESERLFRRLLEMKSQLSFWITYYNYPFFVSEYGRYLLRQGDIRGALAEAGRALRFNPAYPPALWLQAECLEKNGQPSAEAYRRIAAVYAQGGDEDNPWRRRLAQALAAGH